MNGRQTTIRPGLPAPMKQLQRRLVSHHLICLTHALLSLPSPFCRFYNRSCLPPFNMCNPNGSEKRVLVTETIFHSTATSRKVTESVISFQTPVNISEIDILTPSMYLGTGNGGFILGATDPTRISLTFFCNNVDEESASANVELGKLDYDEHTSTKLKCNNGIWTNRLIVFGKFLALTIVAYGTSLDPEVIDDKDPAKNVPVFIDPANMPTILSFAKNDMTKSGVVIPNHELDGCGHINPNFN